MLRRGLVLALSLASCRSAVVVVEAPTPSPAEAAVLAFRATHAPHEAGAAARGPARAGSPWFAGDLEIRALEVADQPVSRLDGLLVAPAVAADTDAVWTVAGEALEEWRVLRSARAPSRFSWRVRSPLHAAVVSDHVELADDAGAVRARSTPLFAYDPAGHRRALKAEIAPEADGFVLTLSLDREGLTYPIAVDPGWVSGPTMVRGRKLHRALALADGRVLFMGGEDASGSFVRFSDGEVYNPTTNTFSSTPATPSPGPGGIGLQLAQLGDGRVLVAGGIGISIAGIRAALWTPSTNTWTTLPDMPGGRADAAVVRLSATRVMLAGGATSGGLGANSALRYDSATNTWTALADMVGSRVAGPFGAPLPSGLFLVCGGGLATCERYNATTNTWTAAASMSVARSYAAAAVVSGGRVLVTGGGTSTAEVYDPTTNTWASAGTMNAVRSNHVALTLTSGKVLVAGGATAAAQIWDPATSTFASAGTMTLVRPELAGAALASGRAIVAGGAAATASSELWGAALGATCTVAGECLSGSCVDGVCCSTASCGTDAKCNLTGYLGTCKKPKGTACAATSECGSAACVDGVCCDTACTGQCAACNVAGKLGTCSPVLGSPVGASAACSAIGAGTACASRCDGIDATACKFPTSATACGSDSCTAGYESKVGTCNGAGACSAVPKSCGVYACGATKCLTTCAGDTDCAAGHYCNAGACVPAADLGKPCKTPAGCTTGFCTDGFCCGVAACAKGSSCGLVGATGTCKVKQGEACATGDQCGTGVCADGVCCDDACTGQCEACDREGRVGVCSPVIGAPHGARPACADGGGDLCAAKACQGTKDRTACVGLAAPVGATCRAASCSGTTLRVASTCDGSPVCPVSKESSCVPYACGDGACKTTCASGADCAPGFVCKGSRCEAGAARCNADASKSVGADGVEVGCEPYLCTKEGTCGGSCASSNECAPGYVCDVASTTCVPGAVIASEGGCSHGGGRSGGAGSLALLCLGVAFAVRRRLATLAAGSALVGCSSSEPAPPAPSPPKGELRAAVDAADRLLPGGLPRAVPGPRLAALPTRGDGVLRVALPGDTDFFLEVTDPDARPAAAEVLGDVHVVTDATEGVDAVWAASGPVVEDARVLRTPRVTWTGRLVVRRGAAVAAVRVREGRIEALGPDGRVHLATAPVVAYDAGHRRRALALTATTTDDVTTVVATLDATDLAFPVVVDPLWSKAASLSIPRYGHASVRLADGRVLVVGGESDGANTQPELYDPATNTWTKTPVTAAKLGEFLWGPGAVLLPSNKVLAVYQQAILYDPATNTWADAKKTSTYKWSRAVLLGSGKVLVANASGAVTAPAAAELFDPATSTWTATGAPPYGHTTGVLVPLASGKVLSVGAGSSPTAQIYDPATNTWAAAAKPKLSHGVGGARLPSGKVVVAPWGSDVKTEIYDPATNTWADGPALAHARDSAAVVGLTNGTVLFTGGVSGSSFTNDSELLAGTGASLSAAGSMSDNRGHHTMTQLLDGRVLVAGGGNNFPAGPTPMGFVDLFGGALGVACSTGGDCGSGSCVDGVCCASPSCAAPASCNQPGAAGTCTRPVGSTCSLSTQCASGQCVDGVCCNSACAGQCEACDLPGKLGVCSPVLGAPRGKRAACSGAGAGTPCGDRCDGIDRTACHLPGASAACGLDACAAGVETRAGTCDATGKCTATSKACGAYACAATACRTSCGGDGDCAAGYFCKAGVCAKVDGLGTPCTGPTGCTTGFCTDGVCCGVAGCGVGESCGNPGAEGSCTKKVGFACAVGAECATGFCVDGVCCGTACDGQCEACDVSGKFGTCTPIDGAPHGVRPACGAATGVCDARTCKGALDATKCVGFEKTTDTVCAAATCSGSSYVGPSTCDGAGGCQAPTALSCTPYVCDAAGCRTGCSKDEHCAEGFACDGAACIPRVARCSADRKSSVKPDGTTVDCHPYLCTTSGACGDTCTTSALCAPGAVCDPGSKTCVDPASASDGGCTTVPGGGGAFGAVLVAGLLGALRRRRRGVRARARSASRPSSVPLSN